MVFLFSAEDLGFDYVVNTLDWRALEVTPKSHTLITCQPHGLSVRPSVPSRRQDL